MPIGTIIAVLAVASGSLVGLVLSLIGGGGSILAVPLLIYLVGVPSAHIAIGTAAIAVALNAAFGLVGHARLGTVKWPCAVVFAAAGVAGALLGSAAGKAIDGAHLLALFGLLLIAVGLSMLRSPAEDEGTDVRLTSETAAHLVPRLLGVGGGVGVLSGLFGIGGGFLIVPGLVLATGMPLKNAIGTSLVGITAFGLATAASYTASGLVDWQLALLVIVGGAVGSLMGIRANLILAQHGRALTSVFASVVVLVGIYIVLSGLTQLMHGAIQPS
jgi:uncharacterized membrane protein YfcA